MTKDFVANTESGNVIKPTPEEIMSAEDWVLENGLSSDCNNINSVGANGALVNAFLAGKLKRKF